MTYNSTPYNEITFNGESAFTPVSYSGVLLDIRQIVSSDYAGETLVDVRQRVGVQASSLTLLDIRQIVSLQVSYSGALLDVRQIISSQYDDQKLIDLLQRVTDPAERTFFERNGYDVDVTLGTYHIDTTTQSRQNGLHGLFDIAFSEGQSRSVRLTIIPPEDIIDLSQFQGKSVTINIRNSAGNWFRVFTGFVDVPEVDLIQRKLTLNCTDRRNDKVIKAGAILVDSIGSYSSYVQGTVTDKAEELQKRLETVTASYDYDSYGVGRLTSWTPKATADFIMGNEEVEFKDTSVIPSKRDKTINKTTITLNYTYQRLHQQACSFSWAGYDEFLRDWYRQGRPSFPAKATVEAAATGSNWRIVSNGINFVNLWDAQGFTDPITGAAVIWQPNLIQHEYKGRTQFLGYLQDSDGDFVTVGDPPKLVPINEPVLDANGKQIQDVVRTTITDTSSHLCRGCQWTSAIRFAQSVTETYTLVVRAPQSQSQFQGTIDNFETVDINDQYDTKQWESSDTISFTEDNFYINKKQNRSAMLNAMGTAMFRARANLLKIHRDYIVRFSTIGLFPQIDLHHTVEINVTGENKQGSTRALHAKGKVGSVRHVIDFNTTHAYSVIELYLSRAEGSSVNDQFAVQQPIEDPAYIGLTTRNIALGTHIGINPDPNITPGAEDWTGYIGNREVGNAFIDQVYRTQYTESFVVDFPSIPEYLRGKITYTSSGDYRIIIPNDLLEISY